MSMHFLIFAYPVLNCLLLGMLEQLYSFVYMLKVYVLFRFSRRCNNRAIAVLMLRRTPSGAVAIT